jgi:hypothetical protein
VGLQEVPRFLPELREAVADLVLEVGVEDLALAGLDQMTW